MCTTLSKIPSFYSSLLQSFFPTTKLPPKIVWRNWLKVLQTKLRQWLAKLWTIYKGCPMSSVVSLSLSHCTVLLCLMFVSILEPIFPVQMSRNPPPPPTPIFTKTFHLKTIVPSDSLSSVGTCFFSLILTPVLSLLCCLWLSLFSLFPKRRYYNVHHLNKGRALCIHLAPFKWIHGWMIRWWQPSVCVRSQGVSALKKLLFAPR